MGAMKWKMILMSNGGSNRSSERVGATNGWCTECRLNFGFSLLGRSIVAQPASKKTSAVHQV